MTEAEWLACADPLTMPKHFRGRFSSRKRCLLACAYALHAPGGFTIGAARTVVGAVQSAATVSEPARGLLEAVRAAVARVLPGFAVMARWTLLPLLRERGEFGPESGRLASFLGTCAYELLSTGDVNTIAMTCLATVRDAANWEARPVLDGILDRHGRTVTDAMKEEVFALIPEPERARVRAGPWQNSWLPERVRNKVYAVVSKPRVAAASAALADRAREVLGNPFRPPKIDPTWRLWNHGAVRHIAEQIAARGNFADMPILADALEDAGCSDEELLQHMRSGTAHVPGCWALDAVLRRE